MNGLAPTLENPQKDIIQGGLMERAFGLGWAAADRAHLPALPEALAELLGASAARVSVTHWNGSALMEYTYPAPEEQQQDGPLHLFEIKHNLGTEYCVRLGVNTTAALSPAQIATFEKAAALIHHALDCILIRQHDRDTLGAPFAQLSDREWQICGALEKPDGEKQIADSLDCSRHTVHSYVKSLYRKLQVRSRLQVLDQLRVAREELRRRTLEGFGSTNSQRSASRLREPQEV